MINKPKCADCLNHDDEYARIPGLTGCKKRLGVWYDDEGIKHPKQDAFNGGECFTPKTE